jgi:hypothetical protein
VRTSRKSLPLSIVIDWGARRRERSDGMRLAS